MSSHGASHLFKLETRRVKAFFRRKGWRETLIFMCFLLCSLSFWYLQALQDDYEIEIVIPVKYKNVPAGIAPDDGNPQEIVAKVRDRGTTLLNYLWMGSFSPLEIDLRTLRQEPGKAELNVSRRTIEAGIMKHLASSTRLLSFDPSTIRVVCSEQNSREIAVEADLKVETEAGFQLSDKITITPATVRIYGPRALLDSLRTIKTIPLRLTGLSRTKALKVRLAKIDNITFEPQAVKVIVPVEEFTEKRLTLHIRCDSVPEGYVLRMFPNIAEAVCNVPLSHFKDLSDNDLEILLPFREFEAHREEGKIALHLTKRPDWLTDYDLNPDMIEFILEEQ